MEYSFSPERLNVLSPGLVTERVRNVIAYGKKPHETLPYTALFKIFTPSTIIYFAFIITILVIPIVFDTGKNIFGKIALALVVSIKAIFGQTFSEDVFITVR